MAHGLPGEPGADPDYRAEQEHQAIEAERAYGYLQREKAEGPTKGPWHASVDMVVAADGSFVCHLDDHGLVSGNPDANVKLIAAAPRMLEVLKAIRDSEPKEKEVAIDEFAYDRLVHNYRDAARAGIEAAEKENIDSD